MCCRSRPPAGLCRTGQIHCFSHHMLSSQFKVHLRISFVHLFIHSSSRCLERTHRFSFPQIPYLSPTMLLLARRLTCQIFENEERREGAELSTMPCHPTLRRKEAWVRMSQRHIAENQGNHCARKIENTEGKEERYEVQRKRSRRTESAGYRSR